MIYLEPSQPGNGRPLRSQIMSRWADLYRERSSWIDHWRDLGEQLQPRRPRFLATDRNKGTRKNQHLVNNTPLRAVRTLSSGMMSGITSPARPWFRLGVPSMWRKTPAVTAWLYEVERRMQEVMAKSNLYNALPLVYTDLGVFGTAAMVIEEDEQDVIRCYVLPVGSYALATSYRQSVDSVYREMSMTVSQLVQRFGLGRVSERVAEAWEKKRYDQWVQVLHAVEPRFGGEFAADPEQDEMEKLPAKAEQKSLNGNVEGEGSVDWFTDEPQGQDMGGEVGPGRAGPDLPRQPNPVPGQAGPREMPWRSVWMELESQESDGVLYEGGFNEWPVMACRWDITGEDVYGNSPGMTALGDARALQLYERRKAQAIDKLVNPPMKGPASLRNQRASLLPGDITYLDSLGQGTTFEPAMVIQPQAIQYLDLSVKEHEARINGAFYADLWLAITNDERSIPATAREIVERHEEKMLQLGPTLERIQDELLDPMVERIFGIMARRGMIPTPPRELQGQPLRVEYISVMSKAQKLVGTAAVERLLQLALNIAPVRPDVFDKLDTDAAIAEYADMVGVAPTLVKDQSEVDRLRQQRSAAQQKQAALSQQQQQADTAKTMSDATLDQDNALSRLMTGIGAAGVGEGM